jgi:hypothetical protein
MAIRNDLKTACWLFDITNIEEPSHIESNDKDYILSIVATYSFYDSSTSRRSSEPQFVWLNTHILKNDGDDVFELTGFSAEFDNDSDFFSYLKWFQEDPLQLIHDFHQKSPYIKNV